MRTAGSTGEGRASRGLTDAGGLAARGPGPRARSAGRAGVSRGGEEWPPGERCGWTCRREFHHRPDGRRCHGHGPERTGGTPAFCSAIPRRGLGGTRAASGDPSSVSHPQPLAVLVDPSTTLTTKSKGLGYRCPGESPGKSPRQRRRFPRLKSHVPRSCSQICSRVPWTGGQTQPTRQSGRRRLL